MRSVIKAATPRPRKAAVLVIPERLWGLNEVIRAKGAHFRGKYNNEKKRVAHVVKLVAQLARTPKFEGGAHVHMCFVEPTKARDPDNVCSGASKLVLDALVKCGVLPGDGWGAIKSLAYGWTHQPGEGAVIVTLSEEPIVQAKVAVT